MKAERETIRVTTEDGELVVTVRDREAVRMTPERGKDVAGQLAKAVDVIVGAHAQGTFGGVLELDVYGKLSRLVQEGVEEWSQTDDDVGAIVTGSKTEEAVLLWLSEWDGEAERLGVLDACTVMLRLAFVLAKAA